MALDVSNNNTLENLHQQVLALEKSLKEHEIRRDALVEKSKSLETELPIAQKQAADALLLSQSKDPQIDRLTQWFTHANKLIRDVNDIKAVKMLSDTRIEVVYTFGDIDQVVIFMLLPANSAKGRLVECKVYFFMNDRY